MKSSVCLFCSVPPSSRRLYLTSASADSYEGHQLALSSSFCWELKVTSLSVSSLEVYYQPHHVSVRLSVRTSRLTFVKESRSKAEERTHSGLLQSALCKICQLRRWLWKRMLCPCERWIYAPALESLFWSLVGFFVSPCNFLWATKEC